MQEDPPQETVAPVVTGFEDLAAPAAPLAPAPTAEEVIAEKLALERELAQRHATKAAADAEERAAAERAAAVEGAPVDLRSEESKSNDPRSEAAKINDQIHKRILEARMQAREAEKPKPPQPLHQHIMEQTKREMAEGAKQSAFHAAQRAAAHATQRPPTPRSATMSPIPVPEGSTPVFRPDDYSPPTIAGVPRKA